MNARTNASPAHSPLSGAGRLAPPSFDMLMRLAIFLLIALAFSQYAGSLAEDMGALTSARDAGMLAVIFWTLIGLAVLWRLWIRRGQTQTAEDGLGATGPGEQLSQAARGQLMREAKAAAAWLDAWRLMWWLALLAVLGYATQLFFALLLVYAAWRGWIKLLNFRRRRIWARAANRAASGTTPTSGQAHAARTAARIRPVYWFERFILSWLLLPARLGMFALGVLWRFGGPSIGDAVLVGVLWCLALLASAVTGILAG